MVYTNQQHLRIKSESRRIRALIMEHARPEHQAWAAPTKEGLQGFDRILQGAVTLIIDRKEITPYEILSMLRMEREVAERLAQSYMALAMSETKRQKEFSRRVRPVFSYMHHVCMGVHMHKVRNDPDFDCNRLANEAIDILGDFLTKV